MHAQRCGTYYLLDVEKDLGVYFTKDLKSSIQCIKSAERARSVLGLVRRHFRRLDIDDFLIIYKTYVRPHLENCIQVWSPHLQKDIQCSVLLNWFLASVTWVMKNVRRHFGLHLCTTKELGVTSWKHIRYCPILRRTRVIISINYSRVVITQEDTVWNSRSRGQDLIHGSISSANELFSTGTVCHKVS